MERQGEKINPTRSARPRMAADLQERDNAPSSSPSQQADALAQISCRLGDSSCAAAHASALNRATERQASRSALSLLRLQRLYGNRFVQRVLGLSREAKAEAEVGGELEQSILQARGGGQALDSTARRQMESAFGVDFGGVRVHTGAQADSLNRELDARAFTTGRDIFFRHGEYETATARGRKLLAHELTHVLQQSGAAVQGRFVVGRLGDAYEQEADRAAEAVARMSGPLGEHGKPAGSRLVSQGACQVCDSELRRQAEGEEEEQEEETPQTGMTPGMAGECVRSALPGEMSVGSLIQLRGMDRVIIQRQATIRYGSVGCPVPEAQEKLNVTGAALDVDGRFGPLTKAAVESFQTAHRPPLDVDGVIGPATWPVLQAAAPGDHGLPTGEDTNSNGWGAGTNATIHRWRQRLTPYDTSFYHCQVREADPGGGTDTCWFAGSAFAPFTAITGGTWDVDANNRWGDDFVGWFTTAVTYYRSQGRAPCGFSFPQSMRVVRPTGDVEYKRNQLSGTIGVTTVSSTRDGNTEVRNWP